MKIKDEKKYTQIISAATKLLVNEGISNFSTVKVAKAVAISQSNIYIYFKNKQELIQKVYFYHVHLMSVSVNQQIDPQSAVIEQLKQNIQALFEFCMKHPASMEIIQLIQQSSEIKIDHSKKIDQENQKIQQMLVQGVQQGKFRDVDLNILRFLITSTIYHYVTGRKSGDYQEKNPSLADIIDIILAGVLVPSEYQLLQS